MVNPGITAQVLSEGWGGKAVGSCSVHFINPGKKDFFFLFGFLLYLKCFIFQGRDKAWFFT